MWKVTKETEHPGARVLYLRQSASGGEGAHRVLFAGGSVVSVWPDGVTTAAARSNAITDGLTYDGDLGFELARVRHLMGALVMVGCRRVEWVTDSAIGSVESDLEVPVAMARLRVGRLPERVRPALYESNDDGVTPLAYFTSDENAARAVELLAGGA